MLFREPIGGAVSRVGHDGDRPNVADAAGRDAGARSGGADHLARLPEDALTTGGQRGEDELRPVLARAIQHALDRHPAPDAAEPRPLLDALGILRPLVGAVAEDARDARPGVAGLEDRG